MSDKSYLEVQAEFFQKYMLKLKTQRGFAEREASFFESIPVDIVAKKSLQDQAKFADFVTNNTVNTCTKEQCMKHYSDFLARPHFPTITNQAGLGNMACILLKINDVKLTEDWLNHVKQMFP